MGFLTSAAAAAVADPERLLWQPGTKLISIPPARPPVTLTDPYYKWRMEQGLKALERSFRLQAAIDREFYRGNKWGDAITVRRLTADPAGNPRS